MRLSRKKSIPVQRLLLRHDNGTVLPNSRYYDPQTGRFLNADAIAELDPESINGLNLYAYCNNNAVMNIDPDGKAFITFLILAIVVGVVVGASVSIVSQGITDGWSNINWGQVLLSAAIGGVAGAIKATGIGAIGMAFVGAGLGATSSLGNHFIAGGSWDNINWVSVGLSVGLGFAGGFIGGAGAKNVKKLNKLALNKPTQAFTSAKKQYNNFLTKASSNAFPTAKGMKSAKTQALNKLVPAWNQMIKRHFAFNMARGVSVGIGVKITSEIIKAITKFWRN